MPKFAVSHIDWFNLDLTTRIVEADDWRKALLLHEKLAGYEFETSTLKEMKQEAFNCDSMIEVVEIVP